jgi:hypothetical protein
VSGRCGRDRQNQIRQRGQRLRLRHPLCAFLRFSRELPSLFAINDENLRSLGFFLPIRIELEVVWVVLLAPEQVDRDRLPLQALLDGVMRTFWQQTELP